MTSVLKAIKVNRHRTYCVIVVIGLILYSNMFIMHLCFILSQIFKYLVPTAHQTKPGITQDIQVAFYTKQP